MSISNEPIGAEPSMDEILSSIRRVLKDSESVTVPADHHRGMAAPAAAAESVIVLESSMMITEPPSPSTTRQVRAEVPSHEAITSAPTLSSATPPGTASTDQPYEPQRPHAAVSEPVAGGAVEPPQPILGAQAADAAASHIGALMRTVSADRGLAVSRGGISIEDIVREEIRPLLKSWLDAQLPGLVERVVRAEIERLVGRPEGF
jgi:cell pole-organizing protein PopZ